MSQQREAIDTYLLRVLHTLLMERSVTRAAVKLNQSQPAISAALRRLRDITGDPLLVRGKSGMVPTEYGLRLLEPTQNALREIERIKVQQHNFDPATSMRCYRIGCPGLPERAVRADGGRTLSHGRAERHARISFARSRLRLRTRARGRQARYRRRQLAGTAGAVAPVEPVRRQDRLPDEQHASVRQARRAHARPVPERAASRADAVFGRPARRDRRASRARAVEASCGRHAAVLQSCALRADQVGSGLHDDAPLRRSLRASSCRSPWCPHRSTSRRCSTTSCGTSAAITPTKCAGCAGWSPRRPGR